MPFILVSWRNIADEERSRQAPFAHFPPTSFSRLANRPSASENDISSWEFQPASETFGGKASFRHNSITQLDMAILTWLVTFVTRNNHFNLEFSAHMSQYLNPDRVIMQPYRPRSQCIKYCYPLRLQPTHNVSAQAAMEDLGMAQRAFQARTSIIRIHLPLVNHAYERRISLCR